MAIQKDIEKYLLGEENRKGYLLDSENNNKVIMLSGVWGCGKTYFWQEKVIPFLNDEKNKGKNKIPNHYISLYGKKSIEEIETELFLELYKNFGGIDENMAKIYSNFSFLAKHTTKAFKNVSEIVDKFKNEFEKNKAKEFLSKDAVICFDDFERKSKNVDLNDLFGFITQLILDFECKVVIILNDGIFEGKEKDIFSNVKEKTVSKFLNYKPTIKELFKSIYEEHDFKNNFPYMEQYIQKCFEEINILNARIYKQVLDNLLEWYKYKRILNIEISHDERRCLVLVNVNFIFSHTLGKRTDKYYVLRDFYNNGFTYLENRRTEVIGEYKDFYSFDKYFNHTIANLVNREKSQPEFRRKYQEFLEDNIEKFRSEFFINRFDIARNVNDETFENINDFIETGILIKDD